MPLKPEILTYLNNDDLEYRFSFETITDGYRVKLVMPLSGPNGTGKDFIISHDYKFTNNDIELIENIPVLEIWPNFKSETWKAYYLYYDNAGQNTFYARPYTKGAITARPVKQNRNFKEMEITWTEYFPEALICERTLTNSTQTIGIILLNQPLSVLPVNKTWKIGIDFGPTGTNVYMWEDDDSKPAPVQFKEHLFQVTNSGVIRASIFDNFIMVDASPRNSFSSIFQSFPNQSGTVEPLLDGHIYYLPNSAKFKVKDSGIVFDLKWGSSIERISSQAFLEQICLQCSAEAVANGVQEISWRFSYPSVFTVADERDYKSAWQLISENNSVKTGIKCVEGNPLGLSESIAFAQYCTRMNTHGFNAAISRGVVCINIGKETTDISIWQGSKNELKWQTTLLLAESDLFLELLRFNPKFLDWFKYKLNFEDLERLTASPKAFYDQLDVIMMQNGRDMLKQLPQLGSTTQVKEFVNIIAFGLAGLFHYIGLLLNTLSAQKLYNMELLPHIYIGGNGANLFHWVAGGNFKADDPINSLFKSILIQAAGFEAKEDFKIMLSDSFKAEVACGLVSDDRKFCFENSLKNKGIIAGEEFILDDRKNTWNTDLTTGMLKRGLQVTSDLNQLRLLLNRFNDLAEQAGVSPVVFAKEYFLEVRDKLNQDFAIFALNDNEKIKMEPIFISALKSFFALIANNWTVKEY